MIEGKSVTIILQGFEPVSRKLFKLEYQITMDELEQAHNGAEHLMRTVVGMSLKLEVAANRERKRILPLP